MSAKFDALCNMMRKTSLKECLETVFEAGKVWNRRSFFQKIKEAIFEQPE